MKEERERVSTREISVKHQFDAIVSSHSRYTTDRKRSKKRVNKTEIFILQKKTWHESQVDTERKMHCHPESKIVDKYLRDEANDCV